jgi:hypothetical protein
MNRTIFSAICVAIMLALSVPVIAGEIGVQVGFSDGEIAPFLL